MLHTHLLCSLHTALLLLQDVTAKQALCIELLSWSKHRCRQCKEHKIEHAARHEAFTLERLGLRAVPAAEAASSF